MAVTNALEAEIEKLEKQLNKDHFEALLAEKRKQLSRIKLIKPFEYSHQGTSRLLFIFDVSPFLWLTI
jgi:hypothetical protein